MLRWPRPGTAGIPPSEIQLCSVLEGVYQIVFVRVLAVDVDHAVALPDQAFRCPENIPETDAEPNLLYYLEMTDAVRRTSTKLEGEESRLPCWHTWR